MKGKRFIGGIFLTLSDVVAALGVSIGVLWILAYLIFDVRGFSAMAVPLIVIVISVLIAVFFRWVGAGSKKEMDKDI